MFRIASMLSSGFSLRNVLRSQHHAASVDLLFQICLEKFSWIGIKVLWTDWNQVADSALGVQLCTLIHEAIDILAQVLPLWMRFGLGQVFDRQRIVQKKS